MGVKNINGDLAVSGEIVENMAGYDITLNTERATLVYGGAVKNGNKLTFAFFGTYTHQSGIANFNYAQIIIPTAVGAKLYPYTLSSENRMLYSGVINMFSTRTAYKSVIVDMQKISNGLLNLNFMAVDSAGLVVDTTYYFRFEITFLLSENLGE